MIVFSDINRRETARAFKCRPSCLGPTGLRAPGTTSIHTHRQFAEDACRAVGQTRCLLALGLYHDIGKLAAPEYFVENQQGDNPHDHLRPTQSAKIITSHVTYGQRLAKEISLPTKIADFIPQHHGTRTLHFFLRKAQALAKPGDTVDEKDFRYHGPKPQFKEDAIMMFRFVKRRPVLWRGTTREHSRIVIKIVSNYHDGQLDGATSPQRNPTSREAMISA